ALPISRKRVTMQARNPKGQVRRALITVALLLGAQACSDTVTPPRVENVTISAVPTTALFVGDTVRLSVTVGNNQGGTVSNPGVSWRSTAEPVATVNSSGLVTAISPGTTNIIASVDGVADTAAVSVQARPVGSCTAAQPLAVGAVQPVDAAGLACVGGVSGAEYVVIGFNGLTTAHLSLTAEGSGMSTSLAPAGAAAFDMLVSGRSPTRNVAFEARLRRRERTELAPYLAGLRAQQTGPLVPRFSRSAPVPAVGDLLPLNTATESACAGGSTGSRAVGRVAAVTARAVVVTDTANPAGGFTDDEYRQIGLTFDTLVYAEVTRNFGEPLDVDKNDNRVIIFYTRAVNQLTKENSQEGFVGGFFFARDLFPTTAQPGFQACAGSNYAEMFYLLAPDPNATINKNRRTKEDVRENTIATIAHELQHLISASRRLYALQTENWNEVVWLNEGLSHIAEELVFYRASGLGPRQNLTVEQIRALERRRVAFNEHQIDNFGRFTRFLEDPEDNSPYEEDDDLATRGATWGFLRYAADRVTTEQTGLWNRLVNSRLTGMENLKAALATEPIPLVRDWSVSVFTDDDLVNTAAIYQQPSWNFRSIYTVLSPSGYPLKVRTFTNGSTALKLAPGGSTYLRVTPPGTGIASVRFRSGGAAPPREFSMFVVRTR
ncbi:MAG: Ig-like domain-containing protein, partial [Gemmatimonadetes bacterium]|nr:Ig-like domain-containing protein [Gemmatimonadota bacterium]